VKQYGGDDMDVKKLIDPDVTDKTKMCNKCNKEEPFYEWSVFAGIVIRQIDFRPDKKVKLGLKSIYKEVAAEYANKGWKIENKTMMKLPGFTIEIPEQHIRLCRDCLRQFLGIGK
jgi:hypothetical protein